MNMHRKIDGDHPCPTCGEDVDWSKISPITEPGESVITKAFTVRAPDRIVGYELPCTCELIGWNLEFRPGQFTWLSPTSERFTINLRTEGDNEECQ